MVSLEQCAQISTMLTARAPVAPVPGTGAYGANQTKQTNLKSPRSSPNLLPHTSQCDSIENIKYTSTQ